jgi:hypothetical protein
MAPLHIARIWPAQETLMTLKTFLLAVTAAVAIFGAAIVSVPSTSDRLDRAEQVVVRSD